MARGMVVIPGAHLGPHQPLLNYTWLVGRDRGASTVHIEWGKDRPSADDPIAQEWVVERVATVVTELRVERPLLVGKSFGSLAAALAADRELPGIWHTPLLSDSRFVAALRRSKAPYLLVGGTADDTWDGALARSMTPHVVEVPDADHGMVVAGKPLAHTAAALGHIVTVIETFVDQQVWPI